MADIEYFIFQGGRVNSRIFIRGFTLVELIIVILLLGILAINVLPKLLDRGGYERHALRDEVISRLRLVQSRNMNEPADHCTFLIIEAGRMAHRAYSGGCPATIAPIANWTPQQREQGRLVESPALQLLFAGQRQWSLRFDVWGRPFAPCVGGCDLLVAGSSDLAIRIEPQGYIHEIP